MKLMTKCGAGLAALIFAAGGTSYAYFENEISDLKTLMDICRDRNISADYERVGYQTLERFAGFIEEDERRGVDESIIDYNKSAMNKIYNDTKQSLEALISGTKKPLTLPEYNMTGLSADSAGLTDGKNIVFSTGYGHFGTVKEDIENLHSFGMNNFQMETGPRKVICLPEWGVLSAGGIDCYYDTVDGGESGSAVMIENKSPRAEGRYFEIRQTVAVEPSARYYYGLDLRGSPDKSIQISVSADGVKTVDVTPDWDSKAFSFVSGSGVREVKFSIIITAPCDELYIDNVFLKKGTNGENLLKNGDFEADYSKTHIEELKSYLKRAEEANVSVSFLLQPRYFWKLPGCGDMYYNGDESYYNISDERAKAKIERYLRTLMPLISDCRAISDICLTNEPNFDTRRFPEFYNPLFREYLLNMYGSLENINELYKSGYSEINEIVMPDRALKSALFYDWVEFNENVLTEWHAWFAGIVREYTNKTLHSKVMNYITHDEYDDRRQLLWGANAEKFDAFSDYSGNDAASNIDFKETMVTKMMWYDYLYSINKKPVYNSEDHFISDRDTDYNELQKNNVRYNLWQGAVHGRSISTMWVWERSYDAASDFYGSILTRPDCVAEAGYTSLDLMRLSEEVSKLQKIKPEAALLYSKTSRVFNDSYSLDLMNFYKALIFSGKRVGFVSEDSYDSLKDYKYLIIPNATHTTPEFLEAAKQFVSGGGKVIYYGDALAYDKFGRRLGNESVISDAFDTGTNGVNNLQTKFLDYFGGRIKIIDNATNEPARDVEYEYCISDGEILINVCGHTFSDKKNLSVFVDGNKRSGMTDIITGDRVGESFEIEGYIPRCFSVSAGSPSADIPKKPEKLSVKRQGEAFRISWSSENSCRADIFRVEKYGNTVNMGRVYEEFYDAQEAGTYMIVPYNSMGEKGESACVSIAGGGEPFFEVTLTSVKTDKGGTSVSASVKNLSGAYKRGILKIIARDENGETTGVAVSEILLKYDSEFVFKASFTGSAKTVEAVVIDNYINKNELSEKIIYEE